MGEFGKFTTARAALIATLRLQSEQVRFQVIVYNSSARLMIPGGCVPATGANVSAVEDALAALAASGRSNHAEAVRRAASVRPDIIILLTDAEDLSSTSFKPALAAIGKPVVLLVARVTSAGLGTPQPLR